MSVKHCGGENIEYRDEQRSFCGQEPPFEGDLSHSGKNRLMDYL
jgi:hypothetical protein